MYRVLLLLFIFLSFVESQAQQLSAPNETRGSSIVDDSTSLIYGPHTINTFNERNLRFNLKTKTTIDTTVLDFHLEFFDMARAEFEAQDLGNMGTAWRNLYYNAPTTIGVQSGFQVFDKYFDEPRQVLLYDTKSPYSWFSALWGAEGRSITKVGYTRNVNKNWNVGFNFKSYLVDKQVGRERRGDRNVESTNINLYSWYRSPQGKYTLLAVFTNMNHTVTEMGGVDVGGSDAPLSSYFADTAQPLLESAENGELRKELHVYQRYQLTELMSVFHELDWGSQANELLLGSSSETSYFDYSRLDFGSGINDKSKFRHFTNKAGITGYSRGFRYEAYAKGRNVEFEYSFLPAEALNLRPTRFEKYVGGMIETVIDSTFTITGEAEYQVNGNFAIRGKINSNFLEGSVSQVKYEPSFIYQGYEGHFDYWVNYFKPIESTTIQGKLKLRKSKFSFQPELGFVNVFSPIYFKQINTLENQQQVFPVQPSGSATMIWGGGSVGINMSKSYVKFRGKVNQVGGDAAEALPMPDIMASVDLGIKSLFFDDNLDLQSGFKVNWQSAYNGMAYDPAIQQFYVQDFFTLPDYWMFSVYLNARIDKGTLFLQMSNLRKLFNDVGYFSTPNYPGVNSVLDFGFNWKFYD